MTEEHGTVTDSIISKKRVIVFAAELLHVSEIFIREQIRTLKTWRPILTGERLVPDGLSLSGIDTCLLCPPNESRIRRWTYVLCRMLRLPHLPSIWRLRKLDASLIHVHFGTIAVEIWPTMRALSIPMLVTLHGYDINIHREWWESGKGGWQRKNYPRRLLRLARQRNVNFIAVSEAVRKRAIKFGIPAEKITVHYIGVDTDKFSPQSIPIAQRKKRILFVGRLVEKKGAEYLIRAFSLLLKHVPDAELVIVGSGKQHVQLEQLAINLNVPVIFTGAQTNEQVKEHMQRSRVFCLPSITAENGDAEGLGLVLLEAQASGLPVISSAMGGANEGLINTETGFSFAEKDSAALAHRLQMILSDDQLWTELSTKAPVFVRQKHSLDTCSEELEQHYKKIVLQFQVKNY